MPWDAVRKIATDVRPGEHSDWQRRGLEIVLRVPDLRKLLERRGGNLRKHKDGTWDFAAHCYPKEAGGVPVEVRKLSGEFDCLWWCKGKPYYVAWDGLRREQSAVAELAEAILHAAQGHPDAQLTDRYQRWHDASGRETVCAGIVSEAEEARRVEARGQRARLAARCALCHDETHATEACPHGSPAP